MTQPEWKQCFNDYCNRLDAINSEMSDKRTKIAVVPQSGQQFLASMSDLNAEWESRVAALDAEFSQLF